jgi:Tfp pilus assembly protein PilO
MLVFDISAGGYVYCFLYSEKINPCHMSLRENFDGLNAIDKKAAVRRARMIALILSGATFFIITFFVFALIQKSQADHARVEAEQLKQELLRQTQVAIQNAELARAIKMEANLQRQLAVAIETELMICKHSK